MIKSKIPSLVTVLILTVITSLSWVAFSVYRTLKTQPDPKVSGEVLEPITPSLDKDQIDKIERRLYFEEGQIPEPVVSSPAPTATASPVPTETSSPSELGQ